MSRSSNTINAHERDRWLRHDAHRRIRHDIARWMKPGADPAEVYPALARKADAANAAAFEEELAVEAAAGCRLLAALREAAATRV